MNRKKNKGALRKNILREISRSKSRFFSIFAIIGISVGFFSGLKSACPSMIETARQYFADQSLMDYQIISTVGFDDEDLLEISSMKDVKQVMPGYMADLLVSKNDKDMVVRAYSLPVSSKTNRKKLNLPVLKDGRMPKNSGECVIENYYLGMSGYKIGDTLHLNPSVEGSPTTDIVKSLDYKIVGVVDSPLYLTYLRGNTNIGEGSITFYILIPPEEFQYERYTCAYLKTSASSDFEFYSDEYKTMIKTEKEQLEPVADKAIERFKNTTLADAEEELAKARREYREKKDEALGKLADGAKKLRDGEKEYYDKIAEAKKKLDDAEQELKDGKEKLLEGQKEYKEGIQQAKDKIVEGEKQLSEGKQQYETAKHEYETGIASAESQLSAAQKEFDVQYQIFYSTTKPQAETKLTLLKTATELCQETITKTETRLEELKKRPLIGEALKEEISSLEKKLKEYRDKLDEYEKKYNEGSAQLAEGELKLNEAKTRLEDARAEVENKKSEGAAKLQEAKLKLDEAQSQLDIGKFEYESAMSTGLLSLQEAQTKLTEGEKELAAGREELSAQEKAGLDKLREARETLENGRYQAHIELSDADNKLTDAQERLDKLGDAKWIINDRDDNPGYSGLVDDAYRVDNISKVFPVFFLLVAGLVCLTTMTRMVEERRTEIGTLKALGYSNLSIAMKYLVYAGLAAVSGSIVGAVIGVSTLPILIVDTYGIMYTLPASRLSVAWDSLIASSVVSLVFICLVSVASCFRDLKLTAAALMRPKAPKPGKRILLEHIGPVWRRMNFTSKVTARNLFRYKARFLMTVIGVAGCTALIVAAFGLRDTTTGIAGKQFGGVTQYDQVIALSKEETADKKAYLMSQIHADERFEHSVLGYIGWADTQTAFCPKKKGARVIIGENREDFSSMFFLRDRVSQKELTLQDDSVIIDERLGMVLGVGAGDSIQLTLNDNLYICRVSALTENYAGNFVYMTPEYYEKLTGKPLEYGVIITRIADDYKDSESEIAKDWMQNEDVITVSSISEQVSTIIDMLSSLDVIIAVMVFCAGLLAVVVLYNLTNINISERVREIATIKVLGFYPLETANFIYRENIILTAVGALTGLFMGNMFSDFIVESIQMDNVMFPKSVHPVSFVYGFVLTFVFSMLVNFIMYFKMRRISMVESLKSVD